MVDHAAARSVREFGDIARAVVLKTIEINITSEVTTLVHSPSATKVFVVLSMHLTNDQGSAITLVFKSASTAIGREVLYSNERIDLQSAGLSLLRGRAIDEDFQITSTGNGHAKGWVQIGEVTG